MRKSCPVGFFAVHKQVPESKGSRDVITNAPESFCLNLTPSIETGLWFLRQVIVGCGLPIAGHFSSTDFPLSLIMVVSSGLRIVGGAEGLHEENTVTRQDSNQRTYLTQRTDHSNVINLIFLISSHLRCKHQGALQRLNGSLRSLKERITYVLVGTRNLVLSTELIIKIGHHTLSSEQIEEQAPCSQRSHGTKNTLLENKLCTGTSKKKKL